MNIQLFSNLTPNHLKTLTNILNQTYWGTHMTYTQVCTAATQSNQVFAYKDQDDELIAFTRVLTDYVFKAMIFDFVVASPYQGKGIGKKLLRAVIDSSELQSVESIELYCLPETVPFYSQLNFKRPNNDLIIMSRISQPANRSIQSI